jgi:hypothetical protein
VKDISTGDHDWTEVVDIDPDNLANEISPEMEECFIQKLGEKRVEEIKAGSEIGFNDYLKANDCLE